MPRITLHAASRWDDLWPTYGEPDLANANVPVRFSIAPRGDSWEVFRNMRFWGIFLSRTEARDTVRREMHQIFSGGGAAEVSLS
ncbi:hypothetical protein AEAC466_18505 [Asticcacaulis sp. AC466]|uniref:hypothetical protein n=1 Tax=Asticcacaulis sp. AC466 TaxID=1282362 RepID=UPI0003C3E48F|nr:hypothetical protein [Asticcacaulis sp. AC466]ESQ82129.1 hypothetical protein AEAC466_18505 [Asticcacaulis sp. AC466]